MSAAQNSGKHYKVFDLCFIDVFLALFVLLDRPDGHSGRIGQLFLGELHLLPAQFQVGIRFRNPV